MVDWQKSVFVDQPDQREGGRIANRDIYGMQSSATSLEVVKRLKEKGDDKKAKDTAAASKKELNNNTKLRRPPGE